jgi:hypothetical protein
MGGNPMSDQDVLITAEYQTQSTGQVPVAKHVFTLLTSSGTTQAVQQSTGTPPTVIFPNVPYATGYKVTGVDFNSTGGTVGTPLSLGPFDHLAPTPPPISTLHAVYLGIEGDKTGELTPGPDGRLDHHIRVTGLQSKAITTRRISAEGYIAELPANQFYNWIIGVEPGVAGTEDWWASTTATLAPFRVSVTYADGTTEQADVVMTPPIVPVLTATYLGQSTQDLTGPGSNLPAAPGGVNDLQIALAGLAGPPTQVDIVGSTLPSGSIEHWNTVPSPDYWTAQFVAGATPDLGSLFFERVDEQPWNWQTVGPFSVTVTYADGTTAHATAAALPPIPPTTTPTVVLTIPTGRRFALSRYTAGSVVLTVNKPDVVSVNGQIQPPAAAGSTPVVTLTTAKAFYIIYRAKASNKTIAMTCNTAEIVSVNGQIST